MFACLCQGYDDSDSRVRKASVFCLVNIYMAVGEGLRPYLTELNSSKVRSCMQLQNLCGLCWEGGERKGVLLEESLLLFILTHTHTHFL